MTPNLLMHVRILWPNEPPSERLELLYALLFITITPAAILPLFLHGWYQILAQITINIAALPIVAKSFYNEEIMIILGLIILFIVGQIYNQYAINSRTFNLIITLIVNLGIFLVHVGISYILVKNIQKSLDNHLKQHTQHTSHHKYMAFLRSMPTSMTAYILKHYPHQQ